MVFFLGVDRYARYIIYGGHALQTKRVIAFIPSTRVLHSLMSDAIRSGVSICVAAPNIVIACIAFTFMYGIYECFSGSQHSSSQVFTPPPQSWRFIANASRHYLRRLQLFRWLHTSGNQLCFAWIHNRFHEHWTICFSIWMAYLKVAVIYIAR